MNKVAVMFLSFVMFAAIASANPGPPPSVPEVDPGSIAAASALIGGVLLMARRRQK